jgi:hypothetical protein
MTANTQTIRLDVAVDRAFEFIADPGNLPRWAAGFARSVTIGVESCIVHTANGDVRLELVTNREAGLIDFHMQPAGGPKVIAYSRVIPIGEGSEFIFTQVQPAGMPDDVFAGQIHALTEELQILRAIFRAQSLCPA